MAAKYVTYGLVILSLFFAGLSLALYSSYSSVRSAYASLQSEYNSCVLHVDNLSAQLSELNDSYQQCQQAYTDLEMNYRSLNQNFLSFRSKYNKLLVQISQYASDINYIYNWLSDNGKLTGTQFSHQVSSCIGDGILNYPCVLFVHNYHYISDGNVDWAKTPSRFIEDRGGDCEDYSFFAAALIRSAVSHGYVLEFAKSGQGSFTVYGDWYYPNADPVYVHVKSVRVVCGEYSQDANTGHCVIEIFPVDGNALYVEPQTGFITGPLKYNLEYFSDSSAVVDGRELNGFLLAVRSILGGHV